MVANSKSRSVQLPLDNINLLSDWTAVDKVDHDVDRDSDHELDAVDGGQVLDSVPAANEPDAEPVTEDAIFAGAKVTSRTNPVGDDVFGKLSCSGSPASEDVIIASETKGVDCSRGLTGDPDRAVAAPNRKASKDKWASTLPDEFSWLSAESSHERRASADSLVMTDDLITAEISLEVKSAPPQFPEVTEVTLSAGKKPSARFEVDFNAVQSADRKPARKSRTGDDEEIRASKKVSSAKNLDDVLARAKIEFSDVSVTDGDDSVSVDDVDLNAVQHTAPVPAAVSSPEPEIDEQCVVRESRTSKVTVPDFPADLSPSTKVKPSPKSKKSGNILGFFKRKAKNGDNNSRSGKPNNVDKPPSKTNIRVLEIMASGGGDQSAPVPAGNVPSCVSTTAVIETPVPELNKPAVSNTTVPTLATTVPAFSSQYMVAVAIDFGRLTYCCFFSS